MTAPLVSPRAMSTMARRTRTRGGHLTAIRIPQVPPCAQRESCGNVSGHRGTAIGGWMRRGDDYVAGLKDGRQVYLDGEQVKDVTSHPAFEAAIRRIHDTYEAARDAA